MSNARNNMSFFNHFNTISDAEWSEFDKNVIAYEAEQKRLQKEKAFLNCGIPDDYLKCSFDNFDCIVSQESELARFAISEFVYTKSRIRLFVLLGKNGTGKTHLAVAALRVLGGLYRHSFDICAEYEDANNFRNITNKVGVIKKYTEPVLLVIDEVGRSTDQKTEQVILSKILTERIECRKKTLIISNSTFKELRSRYLDNATVDRMNVYGKLVQLAGESYRIIQSRMKSY